MRKEQTAVPHSSTESEIISLDTGLRLDGILVFGNTTQTHDRTEKPSVCRGKNHAQGQQSRGMFNVLNNVDRVL